MYDYVIVGAGSAGCGLANRLSEDPDVSVLLLEAGGPDTNDLVHLPAAFSALYRPAQDWDHSTIYEPYANDRRIYLPRGKGLGGPAAVNADVYIRGNPPRARAAVCGMAALRRPPGGDAADLRRALAQSAGADVHRLGDLARVAPER